MEIYKRLEDQDRCMDGYACQEGLLYYKERVYVPNTLGLWKEILSHFHHSKELDDTLCGQGQFVCSVTGLHLPHLGH